MMNTARLMSAVGRRAAAVRESAEEGMLAVVMVVMIIGVGLAAVMTPLVLAQSSSTGHTDSRVQALQTAQTGLNAALGIIRNATSDGGTTGTASALPCFSVSSPLTGSQTPSSTSQYRVSLAYFTSDPLVTLPTGSLPVALICKAGSGLTDASNVATLPVFARITATATAGTGSIAATRTLATTYSFNTGDVYNSTNTTANVFGGQIRFNPRGSTGSLLCLDAKSTTPSVGGSVVLATCGAVTNTQQQFLYNSDLTLRFNGPTSTAAPYGLCVDSVSPNTSITLAACARPGLATYDSQWSFNANSSFSQTRSDSSSWCIAGTAVTINVTVKSCATGYDATASWLPTPYAGTGAAGAGAGQLVNLSQFGRCAQDTASVDPLASPSNALTILYPCEQTTSTAKVDGFQKFSFDPATGHWITSKANDATSYCLTSAGTLGGYVTLTTCSAASTQKWSDNGAAAADQATASQFLAPVRYTIVDSSGRCLSLSPSADQYALTAPAKTAPNTFPYNMQFSKLTTALCDGSAQQKWNADPSTNSSILRNTNEN